MTFARSAIPRSTRVNVILALLAGLLTAPLLALAQEIPVVDSIHVVAVHAVRLIHGTGGRLSPGRW